MQPPTSPSPPRFDPQADSFDRRAGLPAGVAEAVAARIAELADLRVEDLVVEMGAGTGSLGVWLAKRARYLGLDRSRGMLALFAASLPAHAEAVAAGVTAARSSPSRLLVEADAECPWPVRSGAARVAVIARAAHLFDPAHTAAEIDRALARAPGAAVLLGRVVHAEGSPRWALRRALQRLIGERLGLRPREGERAWPRLRERLGERGWEEIPREAVASVPVEESPAEAIERWRSKPGLTGLDLDPSAQASVLAALADWARAELGPLERVSRWEDRYVLEGARRR
jgi:hypothetical protein